MQRNEIISIFGHTGSGKTNWLIHYLLETLPNRPGPDPPTRFLVYDVKRSLGCLSSDRFTEIRPLVAYCARYEHSHFLRVLYQPESDDHFETFCKLALSLKNVYIVIEEFDTFCSANQIPYQLQRLIRLARGQNISIIGISQRPHEVPRKLTSQSSRYILFRQIEPRDVKYFSEIFGKNQAQAVTKLAQHCYFDFYRDKPELWNDPPQPPVSNMD